MSDDYTSGWTANYGESWYYDKDNDYYWANTMGDSVFYDSEGKEGYTSYGGTTTNWKVEDNGEEYNWDSNGNSWYYSADDSSGWY